MRRHNGEPVRRQRGLTVLELTIAVSLMTVVVAVMAPLLHGVRSSWATREAATESLANGRAFVHHFHHQVSQASGVTAVSDPATTSGYLQFIDGRGHEVRYEINAAGDIQFGPVGQLADLAGPVSAMRFTCYDGNDLSTAITYGGSIRFVTVEATFLNAHAMAHDETLSTSVYMRTGSVGAKPADDGGQMHIVPDSDFD